MTSSWLPSSFMLWTRKGICGATSPRMRGRALRYSTGCRVHLHMCAQLKQIVFKSSCYHQISHLCIFFFKSQKLPAQNPILKNITDYLIEEVSAEEEELLGSGSGMDPEESTKEGNPAETTVERDDKLAKVYAYSMNYEYLIDTAQVPIKRFMFHYTVNGLSFVLEVDIIFF